MEVDAGGEGFCEVKEEVFGKIEEEEFGKIEAEEMRVGGLGCEISGAEYGVLEMSGGRKSTLRRGD